MYFLFSLLEYKFVIFKISDVKVLQQWVVGSSISIPASMLPEFFRILLGQCLLFRRSNPVWIGRKRVSGTRICIRNYKN